MICYNPFVDAWIIIKITVFHFCAQKMNFDKLLCNVAQLFSDEKAQKRMASVATIWLRLRVFVCSAQVATYSNFDLFGCIVIAYADSYCYGCCEIAVLFSSGPVRSPHHSICVTYVVTWQSYLDIFVRLVTFLLPFSRGLSKLKYEYVLNFTNA